MKTLILNVAAVAAVVLGTLQCAPSPSASGGDDFPNMIADAGVVITENLTQEWENPASASDEQLSITTTDIPFPGADALQLEKRLCLRKSAAVGDSSGLSFDTETGDITWHHTWQKAPWVHYDTIVFRLKAGDTLIVRLAARKETIADGISAEYSSLTDGDGDGLLINSSATKQVANLEVQRWLPAGISEVLALQVSAGDDADFDDTLDNTIGPASYVKMLDGDTVYSVLLEDGDGDGVVSGLLQSGDSALVDISVMFDAARENTLLKRQETYARMVVFGDSARNYAIRYGVINAYFRRTITWSIMTIHGDSTFLPGDTVDVVRLTDADGDDTLVGDTLKIRAILGSDPQDSLDDALLSIYVHTIFDGAANREILFEYTSPTPVYTGKEPEEGTVHCRLIGRDDRWIDVEAVVGKLEISAEVETSGGATYLVRWNRDGELVQIKEN